MGHLSTTFVSRLADAALSKASRLPVGVVVIGIIAAAAGFLWTVAVVPPIVGIALAVGLAIAWCVWLENHPDTSRQNDSPRP